MNTRDLARLGATLFAVVVMLGAALMVTAAIFDGGILQAIFFGKELEGGFSVVWQRGPMTTGFYIVMAGIVGLVVCGGAWVVLTQLEGGDDIYWWQASQDAERVLADQGIDEPTPLQVARTVLDLEEEEGGWRPETMLRFLKELKADAVAPDDRVRVGKLKADVKRNQAQLDLALRAQGGGVDAVLKLSGKEYVAIELAGVLDDVLREVRRVEGYVGINPSHTPAPVRRR